MPPDHDQPNLFSSLFVFRPREGLTPRENFLTEALCYVLRTDPKARRAWLRCVSASAVPSEQLASSFTTQQAAIEPDSAEHLIFDLVAHFRFQNGKETHVFLEHKWDSPADPDQLKRYRSLLAGRSGATSLVFVGATEQQAEIAKSVGVCDRVLLWQDIHKALAHCSDRITRQFVSFLEEQGLGPEKPLSQRQLSSNAAARGPLKALANKLASNPDFDWPWIPNWLKKFDPRDKYGRVAIEFHPANQWDPCVTLGFLHDGRDHKVRLTDRNLGPDLLLRIEASPRRFPDCKRVVSAITSRIPLLKQEATAVQIRGETANGYTLLLVREPLSKVIGGLEQEHEQLKAIYSRLEKWLQIVFQDGVVDKALRETFKL